MEKQAYKLKLPKKLRIYSILHLLMLKQNIIRIRQVDKNARELKAYNNKKYKLKGIYNNVVKIKIKLFTKALLFGFIKKFSKRKKYLKASFSISEF